MKQSTKDQLPFTITVEADGRRLLTINVFPAAVCVIVVAVVVAVWTP